LRAGSDAEHGLRSQASAKIDVTSGAAAAFDGVSMRGCGMIADGCEGTMEVQITQAEGVRFSVKARTHELVSDQPAENGGNDTGMTPPELLLGALGSCAAYYAVEYLRARKLAETGVKVRVTAEKLKQPARLGNFVVTVSCPVPLTELHNEGLLRAVHHCLIHNSLASPARVRIETPAMQPVLAGS
jgi:putative redox protein